MAALEIDGDELLLHLARWERLAALHGDIRVPLRTVTAAVAEPKPFRRLRGIRAPGTGIPGVIAYATRRVTFAGRNDFSAVLGGRPAVRIELDPPARFARLVVSVPDAEATAARIRAAAGIIA